MKLKERVTELIHGYVAHDVGIDLGTSNTLIYVKGKGIVVNEPTVAAVNQKTDQIVDIGKGAQKMLGRTPSHIEAVKPLVNGVISDFEVSEEMLSYFFKAALSYAPKRPMHPRVVVGVPTGITNVERRAVRDVVRNAGAHSVYLIEEPVAAALGIRLPIHEPVGNMVVDIGGGKTDIAILSLDGVVTSKNIDIAGERFNQDITTYIRDEFKILIGEKTADRLKTHTASAIETSETLEAHVKGRDLVTGLPREVVLTDRDIRDALKHSLTELVDGIKDVLESAPPEILSDVMRRGLFLVGGSSNLLNLNTFIENKLEVKVHIADDPQTAVVRGTGVILEDIQEFSHLLLPHDDTISPRF